MNRGLGPQSNFRATTEFDHSDNIGWRTTMNRTRKVTEFAPAVIYSAQPEELHANIARYVNGVPTKYRTKQMQLQLRNLLHVNDNYTLPNKREASSRVIFSKAFSRAN